MTLIPPTLEYELDICEELGLDPARALIAGVDEAGRGALAGPVTAAAVVLPLRDATRLAALKEVNDSKQLSPETRAELFERVQAHAVGFGVASISQETIDREGILPATRAAMLAALARLDPAPHFLLIDGRIRLARTPLPQRSLIRGDSLSVTIAAASILAKVTRDRYMIVQDRHFPAYGFARHKGYATPQHMAALDTHGPTPLHRLSFAPLRRRLID